MLGMGKKLPNDKKKFRNVEKLNSDSARGRQPAFWHGFWIKGLPQGRCQARLIFPLFYTSFLLSFLFRVTAFWERDTLWFVLYEAILHSKAKVHQDANDKMHFRHTPVPQAYYCRNEGNQQYQQPQKKLQQDIGQHFLKVNSHPQYQRNISSTPHLWHAPEEMVGASACP